MNISAAGSSSMAASTSPNKRLLDKRAAVMSTGLLVVAKVESTLDSFCWLASASEATCSPAESAASEASTQLAPELLTITTRETLGREVGRESCRERGCAYG